MNPVECAEYLRTHTKLSLTKSYQIAAVLDELCGLGGTLAVMVTGERYQEMTVAEAVEDLYRNGLPFPEDALAILDLKEYEDDDS